MPEAKPLPENQVKTHLTAVAAAKAAWDAAQTRQASSQKEVVGLLERKSSWSAADLERYMALIRSEHAHEQAVAAAKESLAAAERALEDARVQLEKRERARYHEEQIWSDTIRRNSTWVTFGLMGVNIVILLASLVVIEPWRRRRLVREVRSALGERAVASAADDKTKAEQLVEADIDAVVEPAGVAFESLEQAGSVLVEKAAELADGLLGQQGPESAVEHEMIAEPPGEISTVALEQTRPEEPSKLPYNDRRTLDTWSIPSANIDSVKTYLRDLFSDRQLSVRKVDLTTATLEGVAAGAALMAVVLALLRPR